MLARLATLTAIALLAVAPATASTTQRVTAHTPASWTPPRNSPAPPAAPPRSALSLTASGGHAGAITTVPVRRERLRDGDRLIVTIAPAR